MNNTGKASITKPSDLYTNAGSFFYNTIKCPNLLISPNLIRKAKDIVIASWFCKWSCFKSDVFHEPPIGNTNNKSSKTFSL